MDSGGVLNQIRGHSYHGLLGYHVSGRQDAITAAAAKLRWQFTSCPLCIICWLHLNLITSALTVVAVALWRKLHSGDKNIFGFDRNNLSLSTEIKPSKTENVEEREGDKRGEEIKLFVRCFHGPLSMFLSPGSQQAVMCSLDQQEVGLFIAGNMSSTQVSIIFFLSTSVFICLSATSVYRLPKPAREHWLFYSFSADRIERIIK